MKVKKNQYIITRIRNYGRNTYTAFDGRRKYSRSSN